MTETITIPRPHVPFGPEGKTAEEADAEYLRHAVKNIDYLERGERLWGSNLTATVRKLLLDAADAVEAPEADRRLFTVVYRSYDRDGKLWTESKSLEEVLAHAPRAKQPVTFQRCQVFIVTEAWEDFTP